MWGEKTSYIGFVSDKIQAKLGLTHFSATLTQSLIPVIFLCQFTFASSSKVIIRLKTRDESSDQERILEHGADKRPFFNQFEFFFE